jgi:hypothetical protein
MSHKSLGRKDLRSSALCAPSEPIRAARQAGDYKYSSTSHWAKGGSTTYDVLVERAALRIDFKHVAPNRKRLLDRAGIR